MIDDPAHLELAEGAENLAHVLLLHVAGQPAHVQPRDLILLPTTTIARALVGRFAVRPPALVYGRRGVRHLHVFVPRRGAVGGVIAARLFALLLRGPLVRRRFDIRR